LKTFGKSVDSSDEKIRDILRDIRVSIDALLKEKHSSGNYPTGIGSNRAELVHWCHGAPGMILLLCEAFQVFKDDKYLQEARNVVNFVWKYGLLRKGLGLCHGIAGNGYTFLYLYKVTKDIKFLYWALKFCEFSWSDTGRSLLNNPDNPWSLFEGIAGTVCFYVDLKDNPGDALFPCFDL